MNKQKKVFSTFITYAFKVYPRYFFVVIFNAFVNAALTIFNAYSLSIVLRSLLNGNYQDSIVIGSIIVLINFIFNFLSKYIKRITEIHQEAMNEAINRAITKKLMNVPYQFLEDPYYLDLKERAKFAVENQGTIYRLLTSFTDLIQLGITLASLLIIMLAFNGILVLILVIAIIFNVLLIALSLKTQRNFYQEIIPINRRFGYYLTTLQEEKYAKDYRLYSVGDMLVNKFSQYGQQNARYFENLGRKLGLLGVCMEVINYIQMGLVYGFVAVKTLVNHLPVSTFSLYISTALAFSQSVSKIIDVGMNFVQSLGYVAPFVELIGLKEEKESGKQIPLNQEIQTIEFIDVCFQYPRTDNMILSHVSFAIHAGEKISLVGLNGAGKTTLVKLLCRLYQPTSGQILVNGLSIYDYEFESYCKQVSAVFQDFKLFAYSLKENILNYDGDEQVAYAIASQVGLKEKIDSLPQGINSLYTKSYDEGGIELSGGEAQKVAIARALYSQSSLVILDEPTSALDPLAEAEIYQHFNDLVKHKTALYISHRMSSSVFCDRILVLNNGIITDFDSHRNLMKKKDSLYYKLFTSQAKNYQK